jgi:hypothetical protein
MKPEDQIVLNQLLDAKRHLQNYAHGAQIPSISDLQLFSATIWRINMSVMERESGDGEPEVDEQVKNALMSVFDKFSHLLDTVWHMDECEILYYVYMCLILLGSFICLYIVHIWG